MTFLDTIINNFNYYKDRNAFFIKGIFYTYGELRQHVRNIVALIQSAVSDKQNTIGVVTNDDIETYASVLAIWFTGNIFVPLNPGNPSARNDEIIKQAKIKVVFSSKTFHEYPWHTDNIVVYETKQLGRSSNLLELNIWNADDFLYLLFTSGSTGIPKGVPVSLRNLDSFLHAFISYGYDFTYDDRFLQIYDFSFDASVHCYIVPLLAGSCAYTVSQEEIKYLYALKLMRGHDLTFVKMPPSTLAYLRPYFNQIRLEKLKYCLLGGEALDQELVNEWAACIPNARIQNVYGPTETTINCLIYEWDKKRQDKQYNGIVSIGKPFGNNIAIVLDQNHQKVKPDHIGELCIAGSQVTPGYWMNPEKNREAFIELKCGNKKERFYRTGDLAMIDPDGDYLFCGRLDEQVQIDGFRVELGEIEKHARDFLKINNVAAVACQGVQKTTQIHLFVENAPRKLKSLEEYLETKLPVYMLPEKIHNVDEFPKSAGGKINKTVLKKILGV